MSAGALLGVTGVVLGAWGAHGLADFLGQPAPSSWATAVQYHLLHAILLLVIGVWQQSHASSWLRAAAIACTAGLVLFSGSIYGLVLGAPRALGPVTPLGGVCLIVAWTLLLVAAQQQVRRP
ncbi:MAG: DUF423 domain-containing protein [Pseudomonadota bacterium]